MTKYVLNSGGLRNKGELSKKFFAEVVKGIGNSPKILICCFAKPREDWEEKFAEDVEFIPAFVPEGVSPVLELAFPATFEKQIKNCDAMYIHGGDDHLLQYWLKKFDIPKIWEGKTIATNSASSHAMSKQFWTCDRRQCMEGLNVLPIKFLAHYKSEYGAEDPRGPIDWEKALEELKNYGDKSLPIYALEEGHYEVIEQ
jgi:hypothetical protein